MSTNDMDAAKDAALKEAEDYGRREGGGSTARAGFYYSLVEKAKEKLADVADAEQYWDRYDKGCALGASMIGGMKQPNNESETRKVRVSECRQFLKMGGLPYVDGVEVMGRAMSIIKRARQDGRLKMKPTDAMIATARAQNDDAMNPLDGETIELKIQPKVANEKREEDRLDKVREELEKIARKFGDSDETNNAIAYVQKRIDDLGGTTAQKRAAAALANSQAKAGK